MQSIFGSPLIPTVEYGGASYGSTFLKSLQTEKLPELDLLVRESVQNSSDASIGVKKTNFNIGYTYETFRSDDLCDQLGEVGTKLKESRVLQNHFLEIRDTKTVGLVGPYKTDDLTSEDHGNYFKLIFDTGINQTQQGSGGNWGFGKSVYYRVSGAGVVIYYSRIRNAETNCEEERLVATMVEDQSSPRSVLSKLVKNPTGRAWWGQKNLDSGTIWPVTNHEDITSFLDIFGLEPFREGNTGTSVIIPFIDEKRLLEDVIPKGGASDDEIARCTWKNSITSYLEHALQKWYAPRLRNKELEKLEDGSKWIRATVNGRLITNELNASSVKQVHMNPFFKLVQELYNSALFSCKGKKYVSDLYNEIKSVEVRVRREGLERESVGFVAYTRITRRGLYGAAAGISPYIMTGNFKNSEDENEPIVMFAREPGMIINYSIDGTWSKGVKAPNKSAGSSDDEYIVAFFVPRVDNPFKEESAERFNEYVNLGGYLRKCEESDHASWEDKAKFKLISKIKKNVAVKISDGTKIEEPVLINASASRLSGRIGTALMPSKHYLAKPKQKKKRGGASTSSKGSRPSFSVKEPMFQNGSWFVQFSLYMGDARSRQIRLEVQTEGGAISYEKWKEDVGTAFPFSIKTAKATLKNKYGDCYSVECVAPNDVDSSGALTGKLLPSNSGSGSLEISCNVPGQTIDGILEFEIYDRSIECVIKAV